MTILTSMARSSDPTDVEIAATLAENLRRARVQAGLQQREVAAKLETSEMQISRWELGKAAPHAVTLKRLSEIYRIPLDVLFYKDHPALMPPKGAEEEKLSAKASPELTIVKPTTPRTRGPR